MAERPQSQKNSSSPMGAAPDSLSFGHCDADSLKRRGLAALAGGAPGEAIDLFRKALALSPSDPVTHNGLGEALWQARQADAARGCFERAVELQHDYVPALVNLGKLNAELGRLDEAADAFHLATAFAPDVPEPYAALARLAREGGRAGEAAAFLEQGLARCPGDGQLQFELGLTLSMRGDVGGAAAAYARAVESDPAMAAAWVNLGLIQLSETGDADRAERSFRRAIQAAPHLVAAHANLGLALQEQGRFTDALSHYDAQLALEPSEVLRWHRGVARLSMEDYAGGWDDYEARKSQPRGERRFPYPEWDGSSLAGKTILVYGEQGVGDEIMFASCLPEVMEQAARCIIECDPRLTALYRRSFPGAVIHGGARNGRREWLRAHPDISVQSAVGSLPRFLRRDATRFPAHSGYLVPDARRVAEWRESLATASKKRIVGLAWRGGTRKTRRALRSVPLRVLAPLLSTPELDIVSLQRGCTEEERSCLAAHGCRWNGLDSTLEDLDECAALVAALDLVVSIDSTIVHLAGACNVPVWAMLPYSADWRYPWGKQVMPWYPSVRSFRQGSEKQWEPVVAEIAAALRSHAELPIQPDGMGKKC